MLALLLQIIDFAHKPTHKPEPLRLPHLGSSQTVALKTGYTLERLPEVSSRPVAVHNFDDVPSLAAWLLRHTLPQTTQVFADQASGKIAAISDLAFERDTVTCGLRRTQAWLDWTAAFKRAEWSQKELYKFLLAHRKDLDAEAASGVLAGLAQLEVIGSSNVQSRVNEKGFLEFSGRNGAVQLQGAVKTAFRVRIPAYLGQPELYDIDVRVDIDVDSDGVTFVLAAPTLEDVALAAWMTELQKLERLLNPGDSVDGEYLVSRGTLGVRGG